MRLHNRGMSAMQATANSVRAPARCARGSASHRRQAAAAVAQTVDAARIGKAVRVSASGQKGSTFCGGRSLSLASSLAGARTHARASLKVSASNEYNMQTLTTWLLEEEGKGNVENELVIVLTSIATACKQIANLVKRAPIEGMVGLAGSANESGDEQKMLDVVANEVFRNAVADSGRTAIMASEEEDAPVALESSAGGNYIVCFDPIDGSSNIDAAVTTGAIFGIYSPGECVIEDFDEPESIVEKCMLNVRRSGNELVSAGYCMFSSSTIMVLSIGSGVYGFTLDTNVGEFILSHRDLKIPDPGQKIYSCNEGNTGLWAPELRAYVQHLKDAEAQGGSPYSYRYIGALVGDFHRTLLYGGIWLYPPDSTAPNGKARLLYEVAPMSFLAEQAGGYAMWGTLADKRVLDVVPQEVHQRSSLFIGSKTEIGKLQDWLVSYPSA